MRSLSQEIQNFYNSHENKKAPLERKNQYKFIRFADKKFMHNKARKLLDIGCGEGKLDSLLKYKYEVTGIDVDKNAINNAKRKITGVGFIKANMQNLIAFPENNLTF